MEKFWKWFRIGGYIGVALLVLFLAFKHFSQPGSMESAGPGPKAPIFHGK